MALQSHPHAADGRVQGLALAGCAAVLLGVKFWLIAGYGSSTPFWDEWAIADRVLRPYLTGTLTLADLFAPHNEHRLLLTRLTALGAFMLGGRWDPIPVAIFNALLHTATIVLLVAALTRGLVLSNRLAVTFFAALLFAVPFSWQNVIFGFHNQYYFLILFGSLGLWCLAGTAVFTPRWWIGTLLAAMSYFGVALGALTLPAFILLAVLQLAAGARAGRAEWLGLLLQLALAAAMVADIPATSATSLGPKSLVALFEVVSTLASWPMGEMSWPLPWRVLATVLIYAPTMTLTLRLLRERAPIDDSRWFAVALAGWGAALILAAAYARGLPALSSRYYDLFLLALLANGAITVHLIAGAPQRRRARTALAAAWLIAVTAAAIDNGYRTVRDELAWRRETAAIQTRNLSQFLATGDFSAINNKPPFHIPFPAAEPLRDWASDPLIRSILPPALFGRPGDSRLEAATLNNGPLLIPLGFALFMIAAMVAGVKRGRPGG